MKQQGNNTTRHEPTEARQDEIIQAARKIIVTRGMEHLTIAAIADEVGLTEGALYRHFESKEQILLQLIEEIEETLIERLKGAQRGIASPLERLDRVLRSHLSHVEQRGGVSFIVIAEALRFGDPAVRTAVRSMLRRYLSVVLGILEEGVAAGEVRDDIDLETAAQLFFGMIQGAVTFWSLQDRASSLARRHTGLWDIYRQGIQTRPQKRYLTRHSIP